MTNFSIEMLDDLPVILTTYFEDYGGSDDVVAFSKQLIPMFDRATEKLYHLIDMRRATLSFNDIMTSTDYCIKRPEGFANHPNFQAFALITERKMFQSIAKGLGTATFGNLNVPVVPTVEEALAWVRRDCAMRRTA
ncbi:MAG: hypothetical protein KC615_18620 [Anaerolineae bacterium]|nr:hypothetical protein [Anaerolineae bacterium]